jgi:separase
MLIPSYRPRKSLGLSPGSGKPLRDFVVPDILTSVLQQQSTCSIIYLTSFVRLIFRIVWLLRNQNDEKFSALLEQFISLPRSSLTKAQENSLLAKLNLHKVYLRFQSDMFLNSLAESRKSFVPCTYHEEQLLTPLLSDRHTHGYVRRP